MQLPDNLKIAISQILGKFPQDRLAKASQELSQRYRSERESAISFMSSYAHRMAYLLARMPATYAANLSVFSQLKKNLLHTQFSTLLDLGAGPGTASWAALETFKEIRNISLFEQDNKLIDLGKSLIQHSNHPVLKYAQWQQGDLLGNTTFQSHDLIIISYAAGELPENGFLNFLKKCWNATKKALVIVEPGTMHGFEIIRKARQELIQYGARIAAPCPHSLNCPMPQTDWCHFSVRLERSGQHRMAKGGTLGYEDEKFSYVVAARETPDLSSARILRHPLKRSGHMCFELCTNEGIQKRTISKRDGELYRQAKKLEWGDSLE